MFVRWQTSQQFLIEANAALRSGFSALPDETPDSSHLLGSAQENNYCITSSSTLDFYVLVLTPTDANV